MKKLLFIFIGFYSFSLYGQNNDNDNVIVHPPLGQGDINNQPEQDKIYSKVDKKITFNAKNLSYSFDYSIIDPNHKPSENTFVVSFVSEVHKKISNLKIETGKNQDIIAGLKSMLLHKNFYPATVNGMFVRSYCKLKFIFDYDNNSMEIIVL
ncbi:hypothetical protein JI747_007060 [Chryseobacterium sp. RG1]|uniref:TonB C-terminal domain-containing protein n=1 Tax=Chryseobacterium tagetis TaxID=2801334 RepID=A0ABS8A218_9FLAO|nr:hypothetical protein [Chryseobacterium tagetis]MCA6066930.1 hypothetical protein [Chryseobacterium tagetis]